MSKRKVTFDQSKEGIEGESSRRFKEKHSLDSDEEYEVKEEQLDDDDIEGNVCANNNSQQKKKGY